MYNTQKILLEIDAEELAEKIEKNYSRYRINISIIDWIQNSKFIKFEVKLKGNTREDQVKARAHDVQLRLKLKVFELCVQDFTIYIIVSDHKIIYDHLPKCLAKSWEKLATMKLPYIVGHDITSQLVAIDLSKYEHLLLGGATNSGKTVGLKALITSIILCKSSRLVNLILIDVGAADLMVFNGIPHLSCPVIREKNSAYHAILALRDNMERRIEMQIMDADNFMKLPRLLLVIDEFPALFSGIDKDMKNSLVDAISSLLQRGRHAKIHVVLAAQNPTFQNMRVDLGNITTRIAYRCAKKNFSETIIGEYGAENLSGKGDMYFKSPDYTELQRIQGIFITPGELAEIVKKIRFQKRRLKPNPYKFKISDVQSNDLQNCSCIDLHGRTVDSKQQVDDKLLAQIAVWALGEECISCNSICNKFHIGWNRSKGFLDRLQDMGVVGDVYAKLPRTVIPYSITDLPKDTMKFLQNNNILQEDVIQAINSRVNK